jgi:hypothetical protein
MARNVALGFDYTGEADELKAHLDCRPPFSFAYGTGEICPVPVRGGRWRNAYHNMSLVAVSV